MRFWSHYGGVVRVTAASDALYLSVVFLFRIGHPPLRIPWNEINFGRTKFFLRTYVVLTLGNEEMIKRELAPRNRKPLNEIAFSAWGQPLDLG